MLRLLGEGKRYVTELYPYIFVISQKLPFFLLLQHSKQTVVPCFCLGLPTCGAGKSYHGRTLVLMMKNRNLVTTRLLQVGSHSRHKGRRFRDPKGVAAVPRCTQTNLMPGRRCNSHLGFKVFQYSQQSTSYPT